MSSIEIEVTNIKWDTDGDIDLPKRISVSVPTNIDADEIDDFISDKISDITGFTHKGFSTSID
jgi:hypothetical protein